MGRCQLCSKHATVCSKSKNGSQVYEAWVVHGVLLEAHRMAEKIASHERSAAHKEATAAENERRSKNGIAAAFGNDTTKQKLTTDRFLKHVFVAVLLHHSLRDFPTMQYLMWKLGFEVGNRHQTDKAAAQAVDVIYSVLLKKLEEYLNSTNPATGRCRKLHLSLDKMSLYRLQRQIVNLRFTDQNGHVILLNLTAGIIQAFEDPVPDYTRLLGDAEKGENYTNGTGVTQHARAALRGLLHMSDQHIAKAVTSFSSDREAVYSGVYRGLQKLWRVLFKNEAFIYFADRCHKLETMLAKIAKIDGMEWFNKMFDVIASIVDRFFSPKRLIAARKMAEILHEDWHTPRKSSECRFIFWSVLAMDRCLFDFVVLAQLWTHESNEGDAEATGLLRALLDPAFVPTLLITADTLDRAVNFSKAGQNDVSDVWRDRYHLQKLVKELGLLLPGIDKDEKIFTRFHKHSDELSMTGTFKGEELRHVGIEVRRSGNATDNMGLARRRAGQLLEHMLSMLPADLGPSPEERLMLNALDLAKLNVRASVDDTLDEDFWKFAQFLSKGRLRFPKDPEGPPEAFLLVQFHTSVSLLLMI